MTEIVSIREEGRVKEIKKSIVKIEGFFNCRNGQLIDFGLRRRGMVMGFNEREVLVLLLSPPGEIKVGDKVFSQQESFKLPVGKGFIGRVINALAEPMDGKGSIQPSDNYFIFKDAPAILDRIPIEEPLETGIRIIDSCIPIGKGQRELVVGDRITGKTTLCVDVILNQRKKNVICIYCCIGKDYSSLKKVVSVLKEKRALDYTVVISAIASASSGQQYLAPYTAAALGEYFMYSGKDVLVVFDDLTKHAWAYRELSLLLERPPGREAYPGDIFYIHSQLMERAGKLRKELGGGSMTFLPIVETIQGDISGFIPTNLISMTDGQIYLNTALFSEGFKPAVDLGLSVSRIGNKVQSPLMRELTQKLRLEYIQYGELLKAAKLKSGTSKEVRRRLDHGEKLRQIFLQDKNQPSPSIEQIFLFYTFKTGALDTLSFQECENFKKRIFDFAKRNFPELIKKLQKQDLITDKLKEELNRCLVAYFKRGH